METALEHPGGRPRRRATPWLLRRVNQRYGTCVASRLGESRLDGLPRASYWLLMALASGANDATRLVGAMGVSKQAVSKVVDALVSGGFVRRRPDDADRRRTGLELTAKGRRTVDVIRAALGDAERDFVAEVGADAWETTVATLAVLSRAESEPTVHDEREWN